MNEIEQQLKRICNTPGVGTVQLWLAESSPAWIGALTPGIGMPYFVTDILPTVQDVLDSLEYQVAKQQRRNNERQGCFTLLECQDDTQSESLSSR